MLAGLRKTVVSSMQANKRYYRLISAMSSLMRKSQQSGSQRSAGDRQLPKRQDQLNALKSENYDVLVVGGGAVGCGCALEAATRGFKTALIEAEDFASGDSCKSSKLIEGSNSYLHAAIQGADLQQIFMLQQVLSERATMLAIAPHLNRVQPMLMPIYSPLRLPLYWLGLKLYDAMAGMSNVRGSHFLSRSNTFKEFPMLRSEGLLGSLVYYDVQLDDARMCLALAMTAAKHGANVANYVRLNELRPPTNDCSCRSVLVEDLIGRQRFSINSRVIINATGAATDTVRKLDNAKSCPIAVPTMGTHIALPGYYGSSSCGLLFPCNRATEQALTMLPFENSLLVGSLNVMRSSDSCATPRADEVECLLAQTRGVLDKCVKLRSDQVLSAWTGVKPAIMCPTPNREKDGDQEPQMVTDFLIELSDKQLITVAGGRWSSYRVMAIEAINTAIDNCQLEPHSSTSITQSLRLDGADDYCCMLPLDLTQAHDLPMDVAQHLADSYGSNANEVLANCSKGGKQRLLPGFPYIKAEVIYACQREYACQLVDVIARRLRVAFVDASSTAKLLPSVLIIMAEQLGWKADEQRRQLQAAAKFLANQMGLGSIVKRRVEETLTERMAQAKLTSSQILGVSKVNGVAPNKGFSVSSSVAANDDFVVSRLNAKTTPDDGFLMRSQTSDSQDDGKPKSDAAFSPISGSPSVPTSVSTSVPASVPASVPTSVPASVPVSGSAPVPVSDSAKVPVSSSASVPATSSDPVHVSDSMPLSASGSVPAGSKLSVRENGSAPVSGSTLNNDSVPAVHPIEQPDKTCPFSPHVMAESDPGTASLATLVTSLTNSLNILSELSTTEAGLKDKANSDSSQSVSKKATSEKPDNKELTQLIISISNADTSTDPKSISSQDLGSNSKKTEPKSESSVKPTSSTSGASSSSSSSDQMKKSCSTESTETAKPKDRTISLPSIDKDWKILLDKLGNETDGTKKPSGSDA